MNIKHRHKMLVKTIDISNITNHINFRKSRIDEYLKVKGIGSVYDSFIVDKGHLNGDEIHIITTTGYIMVYNLNSTKFITMLHARPGQLNRYYSGLGEVVPFEIVKMGKSNSQLNKTLQLNKI